MIHARVLGVADCLSAFNELPRTVQNTGMRKGLNAAGGVIRDAAVANAPRASGMLRKSLKVKVKIPNASYNRAHHGKPAYAVIGPSRRVVAARLGGKRVTDRKATKATLRGQKVGVIKPSRYAHLVEKKHGYHFLGRAVGSHGESAKLKMITKVREHIHGWALQRQSRLNSVAA